MSEPTFGLTVEATRKAGPTRPELPLIRVDPGIEAKFFVPIRRSATLRRTRLLRQLRTAANRPFISIVAPPGYGKTSLLVQWATEDSRPAAWLTADVRDNDPAVLVSDLAVAIDLIEPLSSEMFSAIGSASTPRLTAIGLLLAAVARPAGGLRIVIDDGHRITSRACLDILSELVARMPAGGQLAVAGWTRPRLPIPRWRADGLLLEVSAHDLAMDEREAVGLGREHGLRLSTDAAARLMRQTEGWPALLTLAIIGARGPGEDQAHVDAAADGIEDYLRSEVLSRRSRADIAFMTGTSILDQLSAPLCDAVVGRRRSSDVLRQLAESTVLIDEYGGSYRYHALLRDFLRRELARREPQRAATLHRRAATWYAANNAVELAVDHAFAAGDVDLAGTLVGRAWLELHWSGRRATIETWVRRFGATLLEAHPWLAVLAAWEEIGAGEVAAAVRLADLAERAAYDGPPPDGTSSFEAGRAMLRAAMVRQGAADALANATRAVQLEGSLGVWRDFALWQEAIARLTMGDWAGADAAFAASIAAARSMGDYAITYCVLGHRALAAIERAAWDAASALMDAIDALEPAPQIDGYLSSLPARAARVRLAIHRGDVPWARRELARVATLRPLMSAASPAGAVQCLLALARAHLAIDDRAGARALVAQARDVIRARPDLGVLPAEVDSLREAIASRAPLRPAGATSLTVAELRVLALLPFYLSFKEIGQRLGVKETTIKSQALSIYGKLGAVTRSDAVDLAVDAGLLENLLPVAPVMRSRFPSTGH